MENEITELRNQVRTLKRIVCLVFGLALITQIISCSAEVEANEKVEANENSYGTWEYSEYEVVYQSDAPISNESSFDSIFNYKGTYPIKFKFKVLIGDSKHVRGVSISITEDKFVAYFPNAKKWYSFESLIEGHVQPGRDNFNRSKNTVSIFSNEDLTSHGSGFESRCRDAIGKLGWEVFQVEEEVVAENQISKKLYLRRKTPQSL